MALLDERHEALPQSPADNNTYILGHMGTHDIVMACLPAGSMGTTPVATVAKQMSISFPSLRFGLRVVIGGGIPSADHDIRLGDVVVGIPGRKYGAVVQWDSGTTVNGGKFIHRGSLNAPPDILLTALNALQSQHNLGESKMQDHIDRGLLRIGDEFRQSYQHPKPNEDVLFKSEYAHASTASVCDDCDRNQAVSRKARSSVFTIHYGTITSGNQVIKDSAMRDRVGRTFDALCFEMEAAGLVNTFSCAVIQGICDYSDSHKNKRWQGYAAMTAAAFAKDLLSMLPSTVVNETLDPGRMSSDAWLESRLRSSIPLRDMAIGEENFWHQYWHTDHVIHDAPGDSLVAHEALEKLDSQLRHVSQSENILKQLFSPREPMEKKLISFMREYHSTLVKQLRQFSKMAMNGVVDILPKLVDMGFKVNDSDSDYRTPLHLAVVGNHHSAAKTLVEICHADVHVKDLNSLLPWHLALHINFDNVANNEEQFASKIAILRLLAQYTSADKVKGATSRRLLQRMKADPDATITLIVV